MFRKFSCRKKLLKGFSWVTIKVLNLLIIHSSIEKIILHFPSYFLLFFIQNWIQPFHCFFLFLLFKLWISKWKHTKFSATESCLNNELIPTWINITKNSFFFRNNFFFISSFFRVPWKTFSFENSSLNYIQFLKQFTLKNLCLFLLVLPSSLSYFNYPLYLMLFIPNIKEIRSFFHLKILIATKC